MYIAVGVIFVFVLLCCFFAYRTYINHKTKNMLMKVHENTSKPKINIIVECQPELVTLLETLGNIKQIIPKGEPLPDFDVRPRDELTWFGHVLYLK